MYKNKTITLCLPCRNEAASLKRVKQIIPSIVDEVIVVSNRSTDDSLAVAHAQGFIAIEDNRADAGIGYGYAHMTAIQAATGDIIIGADCDGTYPLEQIPMIVNRLLSEEIDFISCNRYPVQDSVAIPLSLRFGVNLLNTEVRLLYGTPIQDILSGMWVFRAGVRDALALTKGDWNLSPQIKLNAATHPGIRFAEQHIPQHAREGKTHQSYFKTGFSHALWIFRNRLSVARLPATQFDLEGISEV